MILETDVNDTQQNRSLKVPVHEILERDSGS